MVIQDLKNFTLTNLIAIRENQYRSKDGKQEFCPFETQIRINEIAQEKAKKQFNNLLMLAGEAEQSVDSDAFIICNDRKFLNTREDKVSKKIEPKVDNVVSLKDKLDKKKKIEQKIKASVTEVKLAVARCTCKECGYTVEDESDWDLSLDMLPNKAYPVGTQDSGLNACPECGCFAGGSIFDTQVTYEKGHGLMVFVAEADLISTLERIESIAGGAGFFNPGSAIMNAAKEQIEEALGDLSTYLYPADEFEPRKGNK